MVGQFYHQYDLTVQLQHPVQMKKLIMGFNSATLELNNKVIGIPSSILLEGGMSLNNMQPLGTLETMNDHGYSVFSVQVFRKNFMKIDNEGLIVMTGGKLSDQIKSLNYPTVKYLRFSVRRPQITFVENYSCLVTKQWSNVSISISFLSITGYNVEHLPSAITPYLQMKQKYMALRVIGKLCDPNYTDTLNILANNSEVV